MARAKMSLNEKVQKELPEFAGEVASLTAQELNNRLAELAKGAEQNEQAKEDDEELADTQAKASELAAPYKDAKKMIRLKSRYIIGLLKDKGTE